MRKYALLVALFVLCCMLTAPAAVLSAEPKYEMKSEAVIKDILNENLNKRVTVRLETGESLEGFVTKVGEHLVHLSKITGRDFFDATVRIEKISSVIFRVRGN